MNVDRPTLDAAVARSIHTAEQAERLWDFFGETGRDTLPGPVRELIERRMA